MRTKLKVTKSAAIVVRKVDLFLKLSFKAFAQNGPPTPKAPCETPPIKINFFWKNFGSENDSKNMMRIAKIINKAPKIIERICGDNLAKIITPKIVPTKQSGKIEMKVFLSKDL